MPMNTPGIHRPDAARCRLLKTLSCSGRSHEQLDYLKRHVAQDKQAKSSSSGTDKRTAEKVKSQLERERDKSNPVCMFGWSVCGLVFCS